MELEMMHSLKDTPRTTNNDESKLPERIPFPALTPVADKSIISDLDDDWDLVDIPDELPGESFGRDEDAVTPEPSTTPPPISLSTAVKPKKTPLWPSFHRRGSGEAARGRPQALQPLVLPDIPTSAPKTSSRGAMWRTKLVSSESPGPVLSRHQGSAAKNKDVKASSVQKKFWLISPIPSKAQARDLQEKQAEPNVLSMPTVPLVETSAHTGMSSQSKSETVQSPESLSEAANAEPSSSESEPSIQGSSDADVGTGTSTNPKQETPASASASQIYTKDISDTRLDPKTPAHILGTAPQTRMPPWNVPMSIQSHTKRGKNKLNDQYGVRFIAGYGPESLRQGESSTSGVTGRDENDTLSQLYVTLRGLGIPVAYTLPQMADATSSSGVVRPRRLTRQHVAISLDSLRTLQHEANGFAAAHPSTYAAAAEDVSIDLMPEGDIYLGLSATSNVQPIRQARFITGSSRNSLFVKNFEKLQELMALQEQGNKFVPLVIP